MRGEWNRWTWCSLWCVCAALVLAALKLNTAAWIMVGAQVVFSGLDFRVLWKARRARERK